MDRHWDRFTLQAENVLRIAEEAARSMNHLEVGTEHLLLGLMREKESGAAQVLRRMGLREERIQAFIIQFHPGKERGRASRPQLTESTKRVIQLALDEARSLGSSQVDTEHILIALLRERGGMAADIFRYLGINTDLLRSAAAHSLKTRSTAPAVTRSRPHPQTAKPRPRPRRTSMVEQLATDLTALAGEGKLDPVIGRKTEIERVIQILARRTKNNPALIGEPGVGKTAIVEGLAQRIVSGDAPSILLNKKVFQLDVGSLVAGTMYRGQFEERLKKVLEELKESNSILFIDEMHMLVGAGAAGSSVDAANILKPSLARGELQCVGATTMEEYRRHIESDAALERRFQPIMVEEPSVEETIAILHGLVSLYEAHHNLHITEEALVAAARLSARYISDRYLPDKAIDLIDEAASRVRMYKSPEAIQLRELHSQVRELQQDVERAMQENRSEQARAAQKRVWQLEDEIKLLQAVWDKGENIAVTPDDIAEVVSMMTGVPLMQLAAEETERLLQMEAELQKRIVGQGEAINAIARSIRRARAGLKDPRRPIGSFMFLGPTGVGKTELTKALASFLFGTEDALIQLDMSEFMERHTTARLVGAPPGYIGYEDAGQLTEAVRRRPFSIVVFDEVEKAHPEVFNMLLQIMEEGGLSDAKGRKVDFRNAIVIMTANIGAEGIGKGGVGFALPSDPDGQGEQEYKEMSQRLREELKRAFRPEFLNRLDAVVIFRPLGPEQIAQIVDLELGKVADRLSDRQLTLVALPSARAWLAEQGHSPEYGARPLRRMIQSQVEDPLSDALLRGRFSPGDTVYLDADAEKIALLNEPRKPKKQGPE
ncbi:MAG: ATP-dependent Clp protease ATP-binding subunit [Anaerolineae bacterium]|nr:ATP-dependent Clp protease ATP-binding subunit [Anaerolineae bacterium]